MYGANPTNHGSHALSLCFVESLASFTSSKDITVSGPTGFCVKSQKKRIKQCLQGCIPTFCHPCEGRDPEEPQPKQPALLSVNQNIHSFPFWMPAYAGMTGEWLSSFVFVLQSLGGFLYDILLHQKPLTQKPVGPALFLCLIDGKYNCIANKHNANKRQRLSHTEQQRKTT
jgi:hypothetical protein